ncbi:MAG TPA: protein translocase subunit SecF [Longimicrobiaceae bacterium]|nr:protein translocase subunit SecF [Longimicrobiaceae bacterium]
MRLFHHAKYPFLEWRRRAYVISGLLLALGIGAMVFNVFDIGSWLNYGVDFRGGTLVQVHFTQPTTVEQVRKLNGGWEIQRLGAASANDFVIRMPSFNENAGSDTNTQVRDLLAQRFPANTFQISRVEAVGPKVGNELQQKALYAILASFVLTLVYLAFRFEWRFGVAAIGATMHDIIITLGFLALLRSEISTGTVAAFLTIVGYSLNDTIIVFDRIRENLAKHGRGVPFIELLDRSINETLPRTVLTAGTTLATLTALYLFGGVVIRDFCQVLILGIGIGTFSSIFVASPLLYYVEGRWPPKTKGKKGAAVPSRAQSAAV